MTSSYWTNLQLRRYGRRRVMEAGAAGTFAAAFLAACGGDDDSGGGTATGGGTSTGSGATGGGATGGSAQGSSSVLYESDFWNLPDETANAVEGGFFPTPLGGDIDVTLDVNIEAGPNRWVQQSFEYLMRQNVNPGVEYGSPAYGEFVPYLAQSLEAQPGATEYIIKRRPGVKYHNTPPINGREMEVEDWKMSFEHFLENNRARTNLLNLLDSMETPDADTMVLKLKRPYGLLSEMLGGWSSAPAVQPKELTADPDLGAANAIGTGPRILSDWVKDVSQSYVRHEEYWQGKPFMAGWNMSVIPEYANRNAQFLAQHTLDFEPTARDALTLRKDAPEALMISVPPTLEFIRITRLGHELAPDSPFRDERVRLALRRAVNFEAMTEFLSNKENFAAEGIDVQTAMGTHVPADPTYYLDPREGELGEVSQNYLFSVEEAKKLLDAAGYPDGIDTVGWTSDSDAETDNITIHMQELERSGLFRVDLQILPFQEFFSTILLQRAFDGIALNRTTPTLPLDYHLTSRVSSETGNPVFVDEKMDDIVQRYQSTLDTTERLEVLKEYQQYQGTTFYYIPCNGNYNTWRFEWPWLHNRHIQPHLQWLDENMPNRDG